MPSVVGTLLDFMAHPAEVQQSILRQFLDVRKRKVSLPSAGLEDVVLRLISEQTRSSGHGINNVTLAFEGVVRRWLDRNAAIHARKKAERGVAFFDSSLR